MPSIGEGSGQDAETVLRFWFGNETPIDIGQRLSLWFGKSEDTDQSIRAALGDLHAAASAGRLDHWALAPRPCLALVILLDQVSRNIHRDRPEAFMQDGKALGVARAAIDKGFDRRLSPLERAFFYLPFEHSENPRDQDQSVALFKSLVEAADEVTREAFAEFLDYAERHREIIFRFGRFPHRNPVLGRTSTAEETEFLRRPGSSF